MKHSVYLATVLFLIPVASAHAAPGGGSSGGSVPQQQVQKLSPEQKAAVSYEAGIKHRDKAAKFELKAATETNDKKIAKLLKKTEKEYNRAIASYNKSIKYFPQFHEVHGSLGYALRKVGRYDESLAAYDEALRINPRYANAIEYRGEAYLGLNRIDDAKNAYMALFQSEPALAEELLTAMTNWVASRRANADGLNTADVEQFATWVVQRQELASFVDSTDRTTAERWAAST